MVPEVEEALRLHDLGLNVMVGSLSDPDTWSRARVKGAALVASTTNDFTNTNIAQEEGNGVNFTNYWVFDIQPDDAFGSISANFTVASPVLNFQGGLYLDGGSTCASAPAAPTACATVALGAQIGSTQTGNNWEIVRSSLAPGRYIIRIDGTTPDVGASAYSGQLAFRAVPEPTTLALLGLGLLGVGARARGRAN